ncbi:MAG: quaternary ammonium compound-resistance protein SugE [Mycobacterium sp.]|jgi:quaternary ammonium compound-resistance protein SugE|nr:quaternary ammonium compound-resistance protein SugE [Mycobacterium sp.]
MAWLILVVSGVLEAIWATALSKSDGFTRLAPSVTFGVAVVLSMAGLAFAMRSLPPGTSYAVWVGIGAVLTVGYAMLTGAEVASAVKVLLMLGVVACVTGLKVVGH